MYRHLLTPGEREDVENRDADVVQLVVHVWILQANTIPFFFSL